MLFAILLLLGQSAPDPEAAFARAVQSDRDYLIHRFGAAGFEPLGLAQVQGREVRRLIVEPWLPGDRPGIEIERLRDGSVALRLIRPGKPPETHALPAARWAEVEALDDAVFAAPVRDPAASERAGACHGTRAWFQAAGAGGERSASPWECPGGVYAMTPARGAAIDLYVRLALSTQPGCAPAERPERSDYAFQNCFVRPQGQTRPN